MTEEQAKALKVGDKVRYIGDDASYLTKDEIYEVAGFDDEGDKYIFDNDGDSEFILRSNSEDFKLVEDFRIEFVGTNPDFDGTGMVHISAYVNDELLAHLRDIEAEQGREAKRKAIREQITKLEAELEAI